MHEHSHPNPRSHDSRSQGRSRLTWMLGLSAIYMVAEAVGGWWTGSLALLADAGHMASDVGSLALAAFALQMAQRPADSRHTFGNTRAEILAALAQGTALVAVAILIVIEAIERFGDPTPVLGLGMLAIATGGLAVNLLGLWLLGGHGHENLSVRGAWLHVLSDALGSVGAMAAGLAIWAFGWNWADPLASVIISVLVLFGAWHLLREALEILMETAPRHLDVEEIRNELRALADVLDVHDLHVWTIGNREISLSSHLVCPPGGNPNELLREVQSLLDNRFSIRHSTVQIEVREDGSDPDCDGACDAPLGGASVLACSRY